MVYATACRAGLAATCEVGESNCGQPQRSPGSLMLTRRGLASRRPRQRKWDRCRHSDTRLADRRDGFTGQPPPIAGHSPSGDEILVARHECRAGSIRARCWSNRSICERAESRWLRYRSGAQRQSADTAPTPPTRSSRRAPFRVALAQAKRPVVPRGPGTYSLAQSQKRVALGVALLLEREAPLSTLLAISVKGIALGDCERVRSPLAPPGARRPPRSPNPPR